MNYLSLFLGGFSVYLFQTPTDYGGFIAPVFAVLATALTVWSQVKQRKLENQVKESEIKQDAADKVLKAWERLFEKQEVELGDFRKRLRAAEIHIRVCDKATMKLVIQLYKSGIDVDLDAIMKELTIAEEMNAVQFAANVKEQREEKNE